MSAGAAVQTKLANPFPGLRPFREEEEYLFFGRESQVDSMIGKLAHSRFLTVVGTSGSGKSSLVNCGLRPALRRGLLAKAGTNWRMVQFRPGGGPIKALARALAEPGFLFEELRVEGLSRDKMIESTLLMSRLGLEHVYEQANLEPGTNLLIVVDQFEELFRFRELYSRTEEDRATAFVNLLLEAARSRYPIYVVLTMRSDFLGDCSQFEGLPEAINRGEYLVPRMTRDERRRAIIGPVHVGGGDISPILVTRLLNDVGDNPDQLSIMQHALNRTWARWQNEGAGKGGLSIEHYEAVGTMAHALDWHAGKAFNELPDERAKTVCRKMFQALTDKGRDGRGVRRPTRLRDLAAITKAYVEQPDYLHYKQDAAEEDAVSENDLAELRAVIEVFRKPSRSFVMPPVGEALEHDTVIDISHESLMRVWTTLHDWVERESQASTLYLRLVERGNLQAQGESSLLTEPELSFMLDWRARWQPNAAWAARYAADFAGTMFFLECSKLSRDAVMAAEQYAIQQQQEAEEAARRREQRAEAEARRVKEEARLRELRLTRAAAFVFAVLFVVSVIMGVIAFQQHAGRLTEERLKLQQEKFSEAFKAAFQAQKAANDAEISLVNARAKLQRDTESKNTAALAQDQQMTDQAEQTEQSKSDDAAAKVAVAFQIMGGAKPLGTYYQSASDLFEGAKAKCEDGTQNCTAMFTAPTGDDVKATEFSDDPASGPKHWVEWETASPVTVASVALYAAHLGNALRSFNNFELFSVQGTQKHSLASFTPAIPYGDVCSKQPCFPRKYKTEGRQVLSVCIDIAKPVAAQRYRAEFEQGVSSAEGDFTGPMVLQLDAYPKPGCKQ